MRGITRNVYLLGFLSLFNDLTSDMITPLLPVFLASMGLGAGFLGVMEGLANSLSHMVVLFSGWLADRGADNKKLTVRGYWIAAISRLFIAIPHPAVVLLARLSDRVGKGIRTAPRDNLMTHSVEPAFWGKSFGIQRAMDHTGALIAPLLAAWLLATYQLKLSWLFLIACIPALISVVVIPPYLKPVVTKDNLLTEKFVWKTMPKALRRYVLIIFLSALSTPSELFLILKMQHMGLSQYKVPVAWFVLTLFTLMASYLGGLLSDRFSRRRIIALGWLIFTVAFVAFAFNQDLRWAWFWLAIYGIHLGILEASERVYAIMAVPAGNRATALGWYYFAYGVGLFPASFLFGILWNTVSIQFAFLFNAGLTLMIIPLLWMLPGSSHATKPEHANVE